MLPAMLAWLSPTQSEVLMRRFNPTRIRQRATLAPTLSTRQALRNENWSSALSNLEEGYRLVFGPLIQTLTQTQGQSVPGSPEERLNYSWIPWYTDTTVINGVTNENQ